MCTCYSSSPSSSSSSSPSSSLIECLKISLVPDWSRKSTSHCGLIGFQGPLANHSTFNIKYSTLNTQHSTFNTQWWRIRTTPILKTTVHFHSLQLNGREMEEDDEDDEKDKEEDELKRLMWGSIADDMFPECWRRMKTF